MDDRLKAAGEHVVILTIFIIAIIGVILPSACGKMYILAQPAVKRPPSPDLPIEPSLDLTDYSSCSNNFEMVNIRAIDRAPLEQYAALACWQNQTTFDAAPHHIAIISVPFSFMREECGKQVDNPLACTEIRVNDNGHFLFIILIPYGMPGLLVHELTHVAYFLRGIPPEDHHDLMFETGVYHLR